ncbi:SprT-like protein [Anaerosolibacter carboniphilus]|uniref:SprT-like protein n=1 Tax=Anaerosolibacter carboniphilus TaxID=1417629 RepID=A0A841KT15_9FIRM|nr:SprT-like domain-containing protein [Anaerosolibacter carboniphilus]MBB6214052.1 SprT-like protein [Anaerosolibacter carboniphilus]
MEQGDLFTEALLQEISEIDELYERDLLWITKKIYAYYAQGEYRGEVTWSNRLKTSGANIRYQPKLDQAIIHVNKQYADKFGKRELIEILKHELAHYYLYKQGKMKHGHGEIFTKVLKNIFNSHCVTAKFNEEMYRYTYACKRCGSIYKSTRRIQRPIYCGKCTKGNAGKITEEFRMVMKN